MSETTITPQEWARNWLSNFEYYLRDPNTTLALLFLDLRLDYEENPGDATNCPIFYFYAQKDVFVNLLARQYTENPAVFTQSLLVLDEQNQTLNLADWFLALLQECNAEQEAEHHTKAMPLGLEKLIFSGDHPPIPTEDLEQETIVGNETLVGPSPTETQT